MVTRKTTPAEIDVSEALHQVFKNHETELAARVVVHFAQALGGWFTFTQADLDQHVGHPFDLSVLVVPGFLRLRRSRFHFTDAFVDLCVEGMRQRTQPPVMTVERDTHHDNQPRDEAPK